jgi:hypothetical protein
MSVFAALATGRAIPHSADAGRILRIADPGYNTERGPVDVFAGRFHAQF